MRPVPSIPASCARVLSASVLVAASFAAGAAEGDAPADGDRFRTAMRECAAEQGLPPPPEPGQPRSEGPPPDKRPDRARLDKCMSAKGFDAPPHRGGRPPPPPDDEDEDW
ncbi:MAG TPA: hypothetical protein VGD42_09785 [Lysobacter sp.]